MVLYDASGQILGRLSSLTAKRLLNGDSVTIVNAEEAVITGSRQSILREYQQKRD
ncbi:MAG: uL13 family ribosomal protein, partial [Thermoplasmata archaeon]|nr:uL13 family ribosomal protein [Thermoplasmata archaeon]